MDLGHWSASLGYNSLIFKDLHVVPKEPHPFDLTLSLLAHNLYRILANNLPGFEHCTVATINRKFLETGARIKINGNQIMVHFKKKTHLPILFEVPWIRKNNQLSWTGTKIRYVQGTVS